MWIHSPFTCRRDSCRKRRHLGRVGSRMCFCRHLRKAELPPTEETKEGMRPAPNIGEHRGRLQAEVTEKEDVSVTPQALA